MTLLLTVWTRNPMGHRILLLLILVLFSATKNKLNAQQSTPPLDYTAYPHWVRMMDDPQANFFETQKAFEQFWAGKEMPLEEGEIIGSKRALKNSFFNRVFNPQELKHQEEMEAFAFQCKKYRHWVIVTEPYIHSDGSIMSPEERLALWQNHYAELNTK